jgi:glycerol-3-phosphate dehydrogenase subunit B
VTAASDVVVVGAGVAGCAAALAARQAGAQVVVLEAGAGATALAGGAWDVAPLAPTDGAPCPATVADAIAAVARTRPLHPYARLDDAVARVREAHRVVLSRLGGYRPLDLTGPGSLLATDLGLWRRAATAQREVLDFAGPGTARAAVADLGGYPSWDAEFLAASLTESMPPGADDAAAVSVVRAPLLSPSTDAVRHPHELAVLADGEDFRRRLAEALRAGAGGARAILLPPVLGLAAEGTVDAVQKGAGVAVGEAVGALAGPQGLRLTRRIHGALAAAGAELRSEPVARVHLDRPTVRVELAGGDVLEAASVVLATGKHVGGGIIMRGGVAREPLAGLPVRTAGALGPLPSSLSGPDPVEQFGADWWQGGAGFSLGVGYDAQLHALNAHGEPAHPGLFVGGALLDGFDPARDGTGLGCCCTTGYLAGTHAAEHAGS